MGTDKKKKLFFVIGLNHKIEHILNENSNMNPETFLILQSYQQVISPFGDLMRDIIMAVYQKNVDEIIVAAAVEENKPNLEAIFKKIYEKKELQKKIETFDYLFKHCRPEFPRGTIKEWLEGSGTLHENINTTVNIIRNHPLIPSDVKVRELIIDKAKLAVF